MDWDDLERTTYRVEISGWDSGETFFVEKVDLKWDPDGGKEACVQNLVKQARPRPPLSMNRLIAQRTH